MPLIYCGPNVQKLGLKKFAVYAGELSSALKSAISEVPEIGKLIVDCEKLEETRARTRTRGTAEFEYYRRIKNVV